MFDLLVLYKLISKKNKNKLQIERELKITSSVCNLFQSNITFTMNTELKEICSKYHFICFFELTTKLQRNSKFQEMISYQLLN